MSVFSGHFQRAVWMQISWGWDQKGCQRWTVMAMWRRTRGSRSGGKKTNTMATQSPQRNVSVRRNNTRSPLFTPSATAWILRLKAGVLTAVESLRDTFLPGWRRESWSKAFCRRRERTGLTVNIQPRKDWEMVSQLKSEHLRSAKRFCGSCLLCLGLFGSLIKAQPCGLQID